LQTDWTIHTLLDWTARFFNAKGISAPRLEAEILLAQALRQDRVYLYVNYYQPVNNTERSLYKDYVARRARGEPAAYIVGYKEFMSLRFKVNAQVLIPRPETELLVETAMDIGKTTNINRICDIGTGSGAVAVSLSYYCPQTQVFAGDISADALTVANENAKAHGVQVDFRQGDLLAPFLTEAPFNMIIANLPYISDEIYGELIPEIREYEPKLALIAGGDGLDIYRRLIPDAFHKLEPDGFFLFEIGHEQRTGALELMQDFAEVRVLKDYAGLDRVIIGRKQPLWKQKYGR